MEKGKKKHKTKRKKKNSAEAILWEIYWGICQRNMTDKSAYCRKNRYVDK
jgi:hypothetical protein